MKPRAHGARTRPPATRRIAAHPRGSHAVAALDGVVATVAAAPASIVSDGTGRITTAGGVSIQLNNGRGDAMVSPRCVSIDLSGRPQASVGTCS